MMIILIELVKLKLKYNNLFLLILFLAQKIINPIDNLDEESLYQMEKTISEFYNFTKESSKPTDFNDLVKFNEIDLENYLAENGDLNFDFSKLLNEKR
jgi:hypothetical protein